MLEYMCYILFYDWPHRKGGCLARLRGRFPTESAQICTAQVTLMSAAL